MVHVGSSIWLTVVLHLNSVLWLQSCSCNAFSSGLIMPENRQVAQGLLITHKLDFFLRLETLMCSVFLHLVTLAVISATWSLVSQVQYSPVRDSLLGC